MKRLGKSKTKIQLFLGVLIIFGLLIWAAVFSNPSADSDSTRIYFFDVGQGDSVYIKAPDSEDILIDGGPDDKVLSELGKAMNFSDKTISLVVVTHPHADHINGLVKVIERYEVKEVWLTGVEYPSATYDALLNLIEQKKINRKYVFSQSTNKNIGGCDFKVLYPLSSLEKKVVDNVNNSSIVNLLDCGEADALFLADAEISAQKQILNNLTQTDLIKVGHHGSENGLVEDLLKITRPETAIISVGKENSFGHPSEKVIKMLFNYAVRIFRTDQDGTVTFSVKDSDLQISN